MTTFDVKPYLKALGRRIRELRAGQGYSQEGFADKCGVHRTFMGTVERGESNLSFSNILKVASTLGISLAALLEGIDQKASTREPHEVQKEKAHRQKKARQSTH